jgi:hypothetical protein
MKIDNIIEAIHKGRLRISDHADEEAEADDLTFDEVYFSVLHGEIIEDYPHDGLYPSCLKYDMTFGGDPAILSGLIMKKITGRCSSPYIGPIRILGSIGARGK